ncbi:hypothetical protein GCM10010168_15590 [Actinoplanes ianthinogenes]|uniref:Uncharacterized protein n=1 Tax=Actinoplanes ianthinogenes TaxID=122358 RepID=A0ABM7LZM9_9ACTN|nr:hypothetical protein [Actinoplanes ianthinogenes]BCJ44746.1 hypothetical protein Aiant_54030 [Actinoplanes ianthinogenes]GGQ99714.1 hypothetical protein GCM10010168_15590 [Actinoplanes ianthinogenes]
MNMVAEMLLNEPAPVAIWGALWLATVPAMVVLASPAKVRNPGRALADAWAFLIGRPARPRPAAEAAEPADFFVTDAITAAFAADAARSYVTVAAEEGAAFRYAVPAAPVSAPAAVSGNGATAVSGASPVSDEAVSENRTPVVPAVLNETISPDHTVTGSSVSEVSGARALSGRHALLGRLFRGAEARRAERLRQQAGAVRAVRYAEEVRVAAERAGYAADRWQEHWEAASERVDAAFRAWQAADSRVLRSRRAAAFGTPWTVQSPAEYADRERHLHLAVRAAAERGELPTSAVADALTGRGGWDARLHPVDQELVIQRASAAHLEAVWKRAVEAERLAWRDAQAARRNWQSLCQEGILAAAQATAVRHLLPVEPAAAPVAGCAAPVARVA